MSLPSTNARDCAENEYSIQVLPSCSGTSCSASEKEGPPAAIQPQSHLFTPPEVDPDGLQIVRMSLQSQRLSEQAIEIVLLSWRDSTKK